MNKPKPNPDLKYFDDIAKQLDVIDAKRQSMTVSEFREFLPLYQAMSEDKIPSPGTAEEINYRILSGKLLARINRFKPYTIVDDVTGEVVAEMPSIYTPTKLLTINQIRKNENFSQEATHDMPGVADRAHQKLQAGFAISQDLSAQKVMSERKQALIASLKALAVLNPAKFKEIMGRHAPDFFKKTDGKTETQASSDTEPDIEMSMED